MVAREISNPGSTDFFEDVVVVTSLFGMSAQCWSAEHYVLHIGDFNVDSRDDVFLQNIGGDVFPLLLYGRDSGLLSSRVVFEDGFFGMSRGSWKAENHIVHVIDRLSTAFGCSLLVQNVEITEACRLLRGSSLQPSGWLPPRFNVQICADCWAFAPVYALQGLINLYYNQMFDVDLSELHVVACSGGCAYLGCPCKHGGYTGTAMGFLSNEPGVLLEEDLVYNTANRKNQYPLICPTDIEDNETIRANTSFYKNFRSLGEHKLKEHIITYGPGASIVSPWGHAMAIVGFGTVKAGEIIQSGDIPFNYGGSEEIIVGEDSPFVGKTYWIFKQSWGSWGNPKTPYTYVIYSSSPNLFQTHFFTTPIVSKNTFTDDDIQVRDEDGDGYYTWGIGPKPEGWDHIPDEQDGNDNDPSLGPINDLFQCSVIGKNILITQDENTILGLGRYDFGRLGPGEKTTVCFTITNPGEQPLTLLGHPRIICDESFDCIYEIVQNPMPSVIQPGQSVDFTIQFNGYTGAFRKAIVSILSDDPTAGEYTFRLYGYGYEAFNENTNTWHPTIKHAIDAAYTGQVIVVPDGEYNILQQISINKGITVKSFNGAEKTILTTVYDDRLPHRCFSITHADALLKGFTIKNFQHSSNGGAVTMTAGTIDSCIFFNNACTNGGAVYMTSGSILSCEFFGNIAANGGALYADGTTSIQQCHVHDNVARRGGGIYTGGSNVLIQNCLIRHNYAGTTGGDPIYSCGGGIYAASGQPRIELSTIIYNIARGMSGGIGWEDNSPFVHNCVIYFNDAYMMTNAPNYGRSYVIKFKDTSGNTIPIFFPDLHPPTTFSYSNTYPIVKGIGNIDDEPLFIGSGLHPYMIGKFSPCVDAGDPLCNVFTCPAYDFACNPRISNGRVDMGAYEYQHNIQIDSSVDVNNPNHIE